MVVENLMYFLLGLLSAGLAALIVLPAVWRRAVRLTKKRIEAATPITMAEFRADKDQLRAEFAVSTRRLEMTVEALRRRLADQLRDINRSRTELGGLEGERKAHAQIVAELEEREAALRRRVLELEKETADLAQRLRMRDREYAEKVAQLEAARAAAKTTAHAAFELDGAPLTGDYEGDVAMLLEKLEAARQHGQLLLSEDRARGGRSAGEPAQPAGNGEALAEAEAHIAEAESRLSSLLDEEPSGDEPAPAAELLADRLSHEAELKQLREQVKGVEAAILAADGTPLDETALRARLGEIAAEVTRLAYAPTAPDGTTSEESLFERVQRFAEEPAAEDGGGARSPSEATPLRDRAGTLEELGKRD